MSKLYSIKCPNCSAPLAIIGGGRVQTITCAYCKSVIDLNDNYKILSQFKNVVVPQLPFKIGMRGKIENVEWTIIGWIVYKDEDGSRWSEFLLFSALYGYSWLIYEKGIISFSRRIRDLDLRKWQKGVATLPIFYKNGHYLLEDGESYQSVIDFVQGELTWVAKKGDKIECWDYKGAKRETITIERSANELETYITKELDADEVYNSFKVEEKDRVIKKRGVIDRLKEELEDKNRAPFIGIVGIFTALFITIILSFSADRVLYQSFNRDSNRSITINSDAFLTKIELKGDIKSYSLSLYQGAKKILYIDSGKVFFIKKTLNRSWSSSAVGANIYIKLDKGVYFLKIKKIDPITNKSINVKIESGVIRLNYILPLFILILLFLVYSHIFKKVTIFSMPLIALFIILGVAFNLSFLILVAIIYFFVNRYPTR